MQKLFFNCMQKKCIFLKKSIDAAKNIGIYGSHQRLGTAVAGWQNGLCRGLQILLYRFNSGTGLQRFRLSSAVEQSAVNRSVICSNQIVGANKETTLAVVFFVGFIVSVEQMTEVICRSGKLVKTNKANALCRLNLTTLLSGF